jgi:starch synthase
MEPLGIVCLEAMACGAPVVASDVGGLPELVGEDAGLLIEPGDPEGLTQGLSAVLEDDKLARRMGTAGRKRAEKMDWDAISAQVEDLYLAGLKV